MKYRDRTMSRGKRTRKATAWLLVLGKYNNTGACI